ncbi:unnamed protein product [Adineta steineri]|uniref:Uncharacterized protein n=1 Tax=Adineta steineri TaxID=433720 RepID=A0A819JMW2_9BILA|nr:unnamed protein product [Adineta steineri]CAF3930160.1 unnamed protein product [Adineta steineri]
MADMTKNADKLVHDFISISHECIPKIVKQNQESQHEKQVIDQTIPLNREEEVIIEVESPLKDILPQIHPELDLIMVKFVFYI